jgi:hypothetical protein
MRPDGVVISRGPWSMIRGKAWMRRRPTLVPKPIVNGDAGPSQ